MHFNATRGPLCSEVFYKGPFGSDSISKQQQGVYKEIFATGPCNTHRSRIHQGAKQQARVYKEIFARGPCNTHRSRIHQGAKQQAGVYKEIFATGPCKHTYHVSTKVQSSRQEFTRRSSQEGRANTHITYPPRCKAAGKSLQGDLRNRAVQTHISRIHQGAKQQARVYKEIFATGPCKHTYHVSTNVQSSRQEFTRRSSQQDRANTHITYPPRCKAAGKSLQGDLRKRAVQHTQITYPPRCKAAGRSLQGDLRNRAVQTHISRIHQGAKQQARVYKEIFAREPCKHTYHVSTKVQSSRQEFTRRSSQQGRANTHITYPPRCKAAGKSLQGDLRKRAVQTHISRIHQGAKQQAGVYKEIFATGRAKLDPEASLGFPACQAKACAADVVGRKEACAGEEPSHMPREITQTPTEQDILDKQQRRCINNSQFAPRSVVRLWGLCVYIIIPEFAIPNLRRLHP